MLQPVPHMDPEGLAAFKEALTLSKCYLEYGSGGSTLYAAMVAKIPAIMSVESDADWKQKVEAAIGDAHRGVHLDHWDLGEVGEWGNPKTRDRMDSYWGYMAKPWATAKTHNLVPDTILIDGRFRVASFLFSLVSARVGSTILFDDYLDRPAYFVVEEFCPLVSTRGRMAIFVATKGFSVPAICERIAKYSVVPS